MGVPQIVLMRPCKNRGNDIKYDKDGSLFPISRSFNQRGESKVADFHVHITIQEDVAKF